ncbi:hypothetical protein GHT06_021618 [Daphnia sinensis]|uniref:Uncharacterized protein n=1 Tax=Daphnia sinensis TaxID=1820382 RepID=A0AAD5KZY9_9CRUS|nr:hypothetical protein GHT06_021618 [Daphnia sinensis]
MTDVLASFEYLRGLNFSARNSTEVQVLIGMDVQDAHLNLEVRRPPIGVRGPNAVLTPFGWCVVERTFSLPAVQTLRSPKGFGRPNFSQFIRPPKPLRPRLTMSDNNYFY